jgi:hypothetical protein
MTTETAQDAVKEKIMFILTYPISTEINPCGWDVRPVRRDTVELLLEEISKVFLAGCSMTESKTTQDELE